jgi:DNA-binding transcriptional ArsR family regulator
MTTTAAPTGVTVLYPPPGAEPGTTAKTFRALGDPARLQLLAYLHADEHTVSECVTHVGLSQSRVSAHLNRLAESGLVHARRAGRHAYYRVADPRITDLVALAHAVTSDVARQYAT